MVVVSLMTSEPNAATQKMVDDVRVPSGRSDPWQTTIINNLFKGRLISPLLFLIPF